MIANLSTIPIPDLIAEIRRRESKQNPSTLAAQIIAAESESSGIEPAVILSRVRTRRVANARMRCMAALYRLGFSSNEVGLAFRRTHGAVLNALKATI